MNNPLISVIIPNYNHAKYLDQRIQTVLDQTYKNFEVIILDDYSSDNSIEVIDKYRNNLYISQVVVNEVNSGSPFKQWDKGIHLAKGELIWIAESDDYCETSFLEELVKAFRKNKRTVLSYCTPLLMSENGKTWSLTPEGKNMYISAKSYLRRFMLNMNWPLNASCCLFCKECALTWCERYKSIPAAGDYMFWAELLGHGGYVSIVNRHLSIWRMHDDSVTPALMKNGEIAISEKEIFNYICSRVFVGRMRKRFALRYHKERFQNFGIQSESIIKEIASIWNFHQVEKITFGDRVYRKVNSVLGRRIGYFLSF